MEMPLPANGGMMTGTGPWRGRHGRHVQRPQGTQRSPGIKDPGWSRHLAYEWTGTLAEPARVKAEGTGSMPPLARPTTDTEVTVRKPGAGSSQHKEH
jgi:hypothetical protein